MINVFRPLTVFRPFISGVSVGVYVYSFTVTLVDAAGDFGTQAFTLTINPS